jgi:peptide deformylase
MRREGELGISDARTMRRSVDGPRKRVRRWYDDAYNTYFPRDHEDNTDHVRIRWARKKAVEISIFLAIYLVVVVIWFGPVPLVHSIVNHVLGREHPSGGTAVTAPASAVVGLDHGVPHPTDHTREDLEKLEEVREQKAAWMRQKELRERTPGDRQFIAMVAEPASPGDRRNPNLFEALAYHMKGTDSHCITAVHIGIALRVVIVRKVRTGEFVVMLNPEIESTSEPYTEYLETSLFYPDQNPVSVKRPGVVSVRYDTDRGESRTHRFYSRDSHCVQASLSALDGNAVHSV